MDTVHVTPPAGDAYRTGDLAAFEQGIRTEIRAIRRRYVVTAWTLRIAVLVVFLGGWEFLSAANIVKSFYISDPVSVMTSLAGILIQGATWYNLWETFSAAAVSLVVGSLLGISCGVLLWRVSVLARALDPYLTLFNSLPRPALAPLFILWFGLGITAKVFVAVTIVFFLLLLNTMAGLSNVDPDILALADSLGASRFKRFFLVEIPSALPSIVAGLRLGAVYSVLGVVVSEMVASYYGLGQMLVKATNGFEVSVSFAVLALMAGMAVVLDMGAWLLQRRVQQGTRSRGVMR